MKLIYIDEAGNTGRRADPDQPIHMIGSLIVDQAQVRGIEVKLNEIAERCAKSVSSPLHSLSADKVEFHGTDLFGGNKSFSHMGPSERIIVCTEIIGVCKAEGAIFGSCAIDKLKLLGGHPHMRCFQFMLERVQDYLTWAGDLGLIVADEHRELEEQIIHDLAFSKRVSTGWGWRPTPIKSIIDTVHFVKSKHNRLVQACDVLTYFRLKGYRLNARLAEAYVASNAALRGVTFQTYCDANAKPAEKAVLSLTAEIRSFERFLKVWPV
jgi:hypothetical protein